MSAPSRTEDLTPLPEWKQKRAALVARWKGSKDRRVKAYGTLRNKGARLLTLVVSMVGATLVAFGVWQVHAPAGYVVAGLLLWAVQWNYGDERGSG